MAKAIYIGAKTPYTVQEGTDNVYCQTENISDYFTVSAGGSYTKPITGYNYYPYRWTRTNVSSTTVKLTPNNFGRDSTTATVRIYPYTTMTLSIKVYFFSEEKYDKISLTGCFTDLSGTINTTYSLSVTAYNTYTLTYTKDGTKSADSETSSYIQITVPSGYTWNGNVGYLDYSSTYTYDGAYTANYGWDHSNYDSSTLLLRPANMGDSYHSTAGQLTLTAKRPLTIYLRGKWYGESSNDPFKIWVKGDLLVNTGTQQSTFKDIYSGSLSTGDILKFLFYKDGSVSYETSDNTQFLLDAYYTVPHYETKYKMAACRIIKAYSSINGIAQKNTVAYVGFGGIARQIFDAAAEDARQKSKAAATPQTNEQPSFSPQPQIESPKVEKVPQTSYPETIEPAPNAVSEWKEGTSYNIGDVVDFKSKPYESLVNNNIWMPNQEDTKSMWRELPLEEPPHELTAEELAAEKERIKQELAQKEKELAMKSEERMVEETIQPSHLLESQEINDQDI